MHGPLVTALMPVNFHEAGPDGAFMKIKAGPAGADAVFGFSLSAQDDQSSAERH